MDKVLATLKKHPIIVPVAPSLLGTSALPELITYSSLKRLISTALYRPIQLFPAIARVCAALESGDGGPYLDVAIAWGFKRKQFSCDLPDVPPGPDDVEGNGDAFRAIMCSDGGEMTDSVEDFTEYAETLMQRSKAAGAVNVLFRIACAGWKAKAKWRYSGKHLLFIHSSSQLTIDDAGPFEGNTSHPILFIANKADNVTPFRSARNNAKGFNDSAILVQKSYGVSSLAVLSVLVLMLKSPSIRLSQRLLHVQRSIYEHIFRMVRCQNHILNAQPTSRSGR